MLRIPAAAAAIATLLAVFLTAVYLRFSDDDNGAGSRGIPIVVAARDIPAGTRISADMLAFVEGQGDALPFGMPPDPLVGEVTTVSIAQGERITASKITRIASLSADLVYSVDVSSEGCGPSADQAASPQTRSPKRSSVYAT
jgi:Flp pilus assembly protein CpaB